MYYPSLNVFMMNNMPGGMKKHCESNEPESHPRWPKHFASSKLWLFHDGFHTKQQHFTLSSAPAHWFFSTLKSHMVVWTSHWRTMASLEMQFSLVHMHKSLSKETNIIQGCWVRKTRVHEDRESLCHPLLTDWCLNRAWSMILHPILLRKPMRTDLLPWDKCQTSAQAAAKKNVT